MNKFQDIFQIGTKSIYRGICWFLLFQRWYWLGGQMKNVNKILTLTNNFLFILCLWCAKMMMTWIFLLILTRNSFRWGVVVQKKNPVNKKYKQISINKWQFCLHFKKEITILFGLLTSEKGRFISRLTLH